MAYKTRDRKLLGKQFAKLTVVSETNDGQWLCQCECGNQIVARTAYLNAGRKTSCGCAERENRSNAQIRHGDSRTLLYKVWRDMHTRCSSNHKNYGARGIHVCNLWHRYEPFRDWALKHGYAQGLEIDRINNDRSYYPINCRFVTRQINQNNKRTNVRVCIFGEEKTVAEWSRDPRCKTSVNTMYHRIELGVSGPMLLMNNCRAEMLKQRKAT